MFDSPRDGQLWAAKDCGGGQALLGCGNCMDREICGGLHIANQSGSAVDCMVMCCGNKGDCDLVCPNSPQRYMARLAEVDGLDLNTIPVAPDCPLPELPSLIPLVQGNIAGPRPFRDMPAMVAVPLSMALTGAGQMSRAKNAKEMQRSFGATPPRGWVVSGVEKDSRIERVWRICDPAKLYQSLKKARVVFATTPNYSAYINAPRHDNLHSMKRIALTWYEMALAGLPAALHINGRTDQDFRRWGQFARKQVNLRAVAFEFLTGAEPLQDGQRYVARLQLFVQEAGRKNLVLVLRGGHQWLPELRQHFADIVTIDSGAYFKTVKRQRLVFMANGRPTYVPQRTTSDAEVRALYAQNLVAKTAVYAGMLTPSPQRELDLGGSASSPLKNQADYEAPQLDLFSQHPFSASA